MQTKARKILEQTKTPMNEVEQGDTFVSGDMELTVQDVTRDNVIFTIIQGTSTTKPLEMPLEDFFSFIDANNFGKSRTS